jgi:hypothetical protein
VVGYLTGRLGLSHRDVVDAMEALHGLRLGLGSVSAIQDQVSQALEQPTFSLTFAALPSVPPRTLET